MLRLSPPRASAILLVLVPSCTGSVTTSDLVGSWGGEHIALTLTASGGTLQYDCASGGLDEPLSPDANGDFEARGFYSPGKGGPVIEGEDPPRFPALHKGSTDGEVMTLRVTLLETNESVATFLLRKSAPPQVFRCL